MDVSDEVMEAGRARLDALFEKWRDLLGLDHWTVTQHYHRGPIPMTGAPGGFAGQALGVTSASWEYLDARIDWSMDAVADAGDEYLEHAVVHEAMHIWLAEMREEGIKHEERVAESLTAIILRMARKAPQEQPQWQSDSPATKTNPDGGNMSRWKRRVRARWGRSA